ncbi:exonuclease [uncultured Caudovirales phage]|uniref:Exonuclease n=1 Tax=uncultured Caudovirales phage TaxID=2100421 RepID=A0A6J5T9S9_9CAUD|nr:exonuclease [uncultured Caudovirales phage]
MTTALIDADIVCYRAAASCQKQGVVVEPVDVAIMRMNDLMSRILQETESDTYKAYLTGSDNYRYKYNPEYKGNRKDTVRPEWLQQCREHLVVNWNASVEDGQEADDAMGIEQMASKDTIICSIDKDLLMIPGEHYDFVKNIRREQYAIPAIRHFYWQLIMGDRTDNIFGFDGKARQTVPKFLEPVINELTSYDDELDMFEFVRGLYADDTKLLSNGICLWIRRNPDEIWKFPA